MDSLMVLEDSNKEPMELPLPLRLTIFHMVYQLWIHFHFIMMLLFIFTLILFPPSHHIGATSDRLGSKVLYIIEW